MARIEERIDAEASARHVHRALSGIPEGTRRLLELVAVDGLPVADAAAVLGMSAIAARVRLHRARRLLRSLLTDEIPLGGTTHEYA
ncbi:sigma factor-like helix-turn-helix DNA-binding protein [Actinoplanes sp. HUAS TT8]|uniref:sigma factor-like helix-turn-helix DNA-binding protein n=1 Tax=Actinoplanes sp. HUAS TT8 TaxID=3447453 RepID=UPI003F51EC4A